MKFGATTQQQVAAAVLGSALLAHLLSFLILFLLFQLNPPDWPQAGHGEVDRLLGEFSGAVALSPAAALRAAAAAGVTLRTIGPVAPGACTPFAPGAAQRVLRCDAPIARPWSTKRMAGAVQVTNGAWMAIVGPQLRGGPFSVAQRPHYEFIGILLVTILPTVVLCLWASRRIAAPLSRLAELAERVDADHAGNMLAVSGTAEIRLLAEAINRLIGRLQGFAADQRRLVAGVSHDLRTPLTRLRLRLDCVAEPSLRDKLARDVQVMQMVVDQCLSQASAQQSRVVRGELDLSALLATIVDDGADAGRPVPLHAPARLAVRGDPLMLTRAIENLLDNAFRHAAGAACVHLRAQHGAAVIEVVDTGPGIPCGLKTQALLAFHTMNSEGGEACGGTGLGLAITKSVVDAHGGTLTLLDTVPHGLTVRIALPLV